MRKPLYMATLALALLLLFAAAVLADDPPVLIMLPENPVFTDWEAAGCPDIGYVPSSIEYSSIGEVGMHVASSRVFPAAYDLRQGKLTSVRNQGSCGSCWAFGVMGSLESTALPGETFDFSEHNLIARQGLVDPSTGGPVDQCRGGSSETATAYFARWDGPVLESDDPYTPGQPSPTNCPVVRHVQDVIFLPMRPHGLVGGPPVNHCENDDHIKAAIMDYGAVDITYDHDMTCNIDYGWDGTNHTIYKSGTVSYWPHAVCAVGWDDNYPATNFTHTPPGNGAFLLRNSWGAGYFDYMWISYYDSGLGTYEAPKVFLSEPVTNYDHIYQYDRFGQTRVAGYASYTGWFANVYTAEGSNSAVAAASWYAVAANTAYTLYVYVDPIDGPLGGGGPAVTVSGSFDEAGYHTVKLPTQVLLSEGQQFSVVVQQTAPYSATIPLQGYTISRPGTAVPGVSFISPDGASWSELTTYSTQWESYSNCNVCLKAFTEDNPAKMQVTPSGGPSADVTFWACPGGIPYYSKTYTVQNISGKPVTWTASKSANWIYLSSSGGTLAPGESTTVQVNADITVVSGMSAGNYDDLLHFVNTTNGLGNVDRCAHLVMETPRKDMYTPSSGGSFMWITPSGTPHYINNDSPYLCSLPFAFSYFGHAAGSYAAISANGALEVSRGACPSLDAYNGDFPQWDAGIMPYWDGIDMDWGGEVYINTVGTAPYRRFVVTWQDVALVSNPLTTVTFQAVLCETTNRIVFSYQNVEGPGAKGTGATIGLQSWDHTSYSKWSYNKPSVRNSMSINWAVDSTWIPPIPWW